MAPFNGPRLTPYIASGTTEKQGHCHTTGTEVSGHRQQHTIANIDFTFVYLCTCFYCSPKLRGTGTLLVLRVHLCGDKVVVEGRSLSQRFWASGNHSSHAGSLFGCARDAWAGRHPTQVSLKQASSFCQSVF